MFGSRKSPKPENQTATITLAWTFSPEGGVVLGEEGPVTQMGRITEYGYDDVGRVVTTTQYLADGTPVRSITTYDLMGNRAAQENAAGYVTRCTYDSLFRLQSTISPEGVVITNTYNAAWQIVGTVNNLGHTTQKVYDDLGRLVMSLDGENNATQYVYDALGNRIAVIDANDTRTTYLYDRLNRQVGQIANDTGGAQTVDSNVLTQYEYDVFGNLLTVINAENVVVSSRQYDDLNRLIREIGALSHSAYTLDLWLSEDGLRVDRVLLITDATYIPSGIGPAESPRGLTGGGSSLATHVITYGYDDLYRLTAANVSGDLTASYGYGYDVLGNRMVYIATLTNTVVTTYACDAANRLETAVADDTGIIWHYVYDNNGRRLQQLPGSLTPTEGAIQYTYDQRGQLVQVETHDGSSFQLQAEMVYDGNGCCLQAIAHAGGSAITAIYTLDPRSGLPLLVDNGMNVTMILYGQVAIGEYAVQTAESAVTNSGYAASNSTSSRYSASYSASLITGASRTW
jgi:YD repeat-containing protein